MGYLLALVRYFLYYMGRIIFCRLLPKELSYRITRLMADAHYFLARPTRRALISNLRVVWGKEKGEREIRRMAHRTFRRFSGYAVDFFYSPQINRDNIDDWVEIKDLRYMDEALSRGKGVVALSAHLGSWDLGAITLALKDYPISAVTLRHGERRATDIFRKQREAKGVKVIPLGAAVRRCFQALKDNELVAMLGDWDVEGRGMRVDFFGREAVVPRGPATLALEMGAAIVPTFMFKKGNRYELTFKKPILPKPTGVKEKDILNLTKEYLKVIEKYIRNHPEEWFLYHQMWPSP
ncbi:lysophospholipid acyltransferase family protein [bacterium]|nr:lysophospholipid acyltransferase family protein [bacterium]